MKEKTGLLQEELLQELHRRGYVDVKLRQIIDWRFRGVLPAFDFQGAGRGRSSGRLPSQWSNPHTIIEHAVWITELLNLYGSYKQVYVPLWLLGYQIEPHHIGKRCRSRLKEPWRASNENVVQTETWKMF